MVAKTLEVLRLSPEEAMDADGRRITVNQAKVDGKDLAIAFDPKNDTVMILPLAKAVPPGQSVTAEIDFLVELARQMGAVGASSGRDVSPELVPGSRPR